MMTKRKSLLIALAASLLVNALMIGTWLGHRLHGDPMMQSMSRHILKRPPETLSEQARSVLQAERGGMREAYRTLRHSRRQVAELLADQPLDAVALAAALAEVREADVALKRLSHEVLLQVLPQMPPQERLAMLRPHKRKGSKGTCPSAADKTLRPPAQ